MPIKILIQVHETSEFRAVGYKKHFVRVSASALKRLEIPLAPNLRSPSNNHVVKGMLKDLEEGRLKEISHPLEIACSKLVHVRGRDGKPFIELEFEDGYGLFNGAHRAKFINLASLRGRDLDDKLENLIVYLDISEGLPLKAVHDRAIQANTSQVVSRPTIANYKGEYEWIKEVTGDYPYIRFYQNQPNTYDDWTCAVNNIAMLPQLVNPKFDRYATFSDKAHPTYLAANKSPGGIVLNDYPFPRDNPHLIPDLIGVMVAVLEKIDEDHRHNTPVPFVRIPKTASPTRLPTGGVLSCKIPARVYTHPIISAFRVWLDNGQWVFPLESFQRKLIGVLWNRYRQLLTPERAAYRAEGLSRNVDIWNALYDKSNEVFKGYIGKNSA